MMEKDRGRRKRTERAKKWREWALIMRFASEMTPRRLRLWVDMDTVTERRDNVGDDDDEKN